MLLGEASRGGRSEGKNSGSRTQVLPEERMEGKEPAPTEEVLRLLWRRG